MKEQIITAAKDVFLRDGYGASIDSIVAAAGIARQTLHRILAGTLAVSPAIALRLGKFCGNGPDLWLNMQRARDLWKAEREMGAELAKIQTHKAA